MIERVFEDRSGRRRSRLIAVSWLFGAGASILGTVFALSLAVVPFLPSATPKAIRRRIAESPTLNHRHQAARAALLAQRRHAPEPKPIVNMNRRLAIAFYAPWEEQGIESFRAHASELHIVIPAWLRLAADGTSLDTSDFELDQNPRNNDLIQIARTNGVAVMPLLSNAWNGTFDSQRVGALLRHPEAQYRLRQQLLEWTLSHHFQGLNLDFEMLRARDWKQAGQFVADLSSDFHARGLQISLDLEAEISTKAVQRAVAAADWSAIMVYDKHSEESGPGPIAPLSWSDRIWKHWRAAFAPKKLVFAVGSYGYDWAGAAPAEPLSFDAVMSNAQGYREGERPQDVIAIDDASVNPYFRYEDDDDHPHKVWFLDAITAYNQWTLAHDDARGIALWVLGDEDPGVWRFINRNDLDSKPSGAGLSEVHFPYQIDFVGRGEVLQVRQRPQTGARTYSIDSGDHLIYDWQYDRYAFPYILQKSGYRPKELLLSFDDGPDARYTPEILRKLKELKAPAIFFVLGQEAVKHPHLVADMFAAGHEIGSHSYTHPNLGAVSEQRALLEMNATQRALEAILGRSTRLFRPPFNADSQPETAEQVRPVELADRLHYITVAENVDPLDWELRVRLPDGGTRRKTRDDIAQAVIADVERRSGTQDEGNIILLHDAGGNREATVEALPLIVSQLRERGYRFVSLAELLGTSRDLLMPVASVSDLHYLGIDRAVFATTTAAQMLLEWLFYAAIVIGIGRAVLVTTLAWGNRRERTFRAASGSAGVLLAAYNEETVIAETLRSVLASRYPLKEVIVVDDGSTDGTAEIVRGEFAQDPRVVLLSKPNGGKASALNFGYRRATSDILICLDADTLLHPDAIQYLMRHFDRPDVAAVAGNVRVGNASSILTRWQSLEYTTSQNIDRRAYERLNCITVVPGAIGAWCRDEVIAAGGYSTDTLAEDMELTWRLRLRGKRIENDADALSFTEAPESFQAFFKQRFRWAYGTLQCLWKHRRALGHYGWFGRFAVPQLWLFQVVFQILAPLVDLTVLLGIVKALWILITARASSIEVDQLSIAQVNLSNVLGSYAVFFVIELIAAFLSFRWEKRPVNDLWFLFLQRIVYRQIMYGVIWKAIGRAASGGLTGWGKLNRLGTARAESREVTPFSQSRN